MIKKLIIVTYLMLCGYGLFTLKAQTVESFTEIGYSAEVAGQLLNGEELKNLNGKAIAYLPTRALLSGNLAGQINALRPEVVIERLKFVKSSEADRLALFNALLNWQSLQGVNQTRSNPFSERPRTFETLFGQDHSLFGQTYWTASYTTQGDEVAIMVKNNEALKRAKIFTFADANDFQTLIYYVPVTGGYLLYIASFNRKDSIVGFRSKNLRDEGLDNLLTGFQTWFTTLHSRL